MHLRPQADHQLAEVERPQVLHLSHLGQVVVSGEQQAAGNRKLRVLLDLAAGRCADCSVDQLAAIVLPPIEQRREEDFVESRRPTPATAATKAVCPRGGAEK